MGDGLGGWGKGEWKLATGGAWGMGRGAGGGVLANAFLFWYFWFVNKSRLGGLARAMSLSAGVRSAIATKAARARWARRDSGIIPIAEIRKVVRAALQGRQAEVYLFGSYARNEATPSSDLDLAVIEDETPENLLGEISSLRRAMNFQKDFDLIVLDRASFEKWKGEYGTVQHEIFREGVRLV